MPAWALHVATGGGVDAELAADALWQAGAVAVEERTAGGGTLLVAAVADGGDPAPLLAAVGGRWAAEAVAVDLDAALDAWRPHARAVAVGRLVVRPPWVPGSGTGAGVPADGAEIVIDPGRAFGSGSHASTRLALAALDEAVAGGEQVLDVGCGSGILAVAALALGAAAAVGVDVDPAARAATTANARRNGVADRLRVAGATVADAATGGAGRPGSRGGGFDLVAANLLAPALTELAPEVLAVLRPGGTLVVSGLLAGQRARVLGAYGDLVLGSERAEGDWQALTLRR